MNFTIGILQKINSIRFNQNFKAFFGDQQEAVQHQMEHSIHGQVLLVTFTSLTIVK